MATLRKRQSALIEIKKAYAQYRAIGALVAALALAGVSLAVLTGSDVLALGANHVAVTLTGIEDMSPSLTIGQEADFKIRIQTAQQVIDATLWVQVRADGIALNDPTVMQVSYRHPGDESFRFITLKPIEGTLKGPLKSSWTIPAGYDDTAEVLITFLSGNDQGIPYFFDLWAEGALGTAPAPASMTLAASLQPLHF